MVSINGEIIDSAGSMPEASGKYHRHGPSVICRMVSEISLRCQYPSFPYSRDPCDNGRANQCRDSGQAPFALFLC
jgi:hypothetical protein